MSAPSPPPPPVLSHGDFNVVTGDTTFTLQHLAGATATVCSIVTVFALVNVVVVNEYIRRRRALTSFSTV